jgi:PAS domain S-box-containing protein
MHHSFLFDTDQFNRLFPFYIRIGRGLQMEALGHSLLKLCGPLQSDSFTAHFTIPRPHSPVHAFDDLLQLQSQLIVLQNTTDNNIKLRGQLEYLDKTDEVLFVGSPWFDSMEQVKAYDLNIEDFANHDPMIDLLHVLKTQEITNDDLKALVTTINRQKKELKQANQEIHDIALFPKQNPDPLIRINFDGDILLNNPAAAQLDFFLYKNEELRNDDFFKLIARLIDKSISRWVIEAASGNRFYSFICVTIMEEGYINIYGRDTTQKKKDKDALTRLSLVASANQNAVLFTNTAGYITWANDAFCHMTGYAMDEVIGKSPVALCAGPLTDNTALDALLHAFFNGAHFATDLVFHCKDQTWFWGHTDIQPLRNEHGQISEFFGIIKDVTEEKDTDERLKVLSQIAEDNINTVIIADKNGDITWVNKSFTKMTGYSLEEVIGQKPGHLLQGPETDRDTIQYLARQIQQGEPFNTEIINYNKQGEKYWLRIQGQAIRNSKGEITGYFALEEDITKEKESERRFRKVLESIGDNAWEHDFGTGETYFSKSYDDFLGYTKEEFVSNQQLWWNSVHPEDLHLLEESDRKYKAGNVDSHQLEYRVLHKNGSIHWVLDRGVTITKDSDGRPLRIAGTHTDITGSKQLEAELANRVKQFQSLSENIPGVIYEFEFRKDGTEGLRYISPAIEKIFGITQEEFTNYLQYIHPDDRAMVIEKNRHSRETLEPFYAETRLVIPGQPLRWHSVHSSYSYTTEQGHNVFTGFLLDITKRKNAEQELENQRRFYENILNNMPSDIAVFSPNHEYLFVNPRGIKDAELRQWIIGKRDEDYCAYRNKPIEIAMSRRATFNHVVQYKQPKEWEEKMVKPDGEVQFILRRWYPVTNAEGKVELVIGYGLDITERKRFEEALKTNEEKYRGIIANMNLGLMEMDPGGRIVFANQTLLHMTGISEQEIIGYDAMNFLADSSINDVKKRMRQRKFGVSEAYVVQVSINGRQGWWFVSSAPRFGAAGEHKGSIVICLDISSQKKLEEDLIKAREQAEMLARTKETFLANMSHEIRTPMNAIIGMGNQLSKTALTGQQQIYLTTIKTAAENLLVIINDILDLSRIEAGKLSVEKIPFEPAKVLAHAMQVLMHKAEEKGLKLTNACNDTRMAPVLIGDPHRINQVLLNLISNAIKFTEKGSVDIVCEIIHDDPDTQTVQFSIIDTGIGMDPEFVARLFDKFSQEYESISRKYGGTGLGMSISKELVELMGGSIEVMSKKGEGTTIKFDLLFSKGNISDVAEIKTPMISEEFLQGKCILVTDDNEMNRLVAATILESYGATILEAGDGEEAVQKALASNPDLILMDIQMPVMNGYDATRELRRKQSSIPIIALTANAIKGEQEKCLHAGMDDYIAKPFKEDELMHLLAKWIKPGGTTTPRKDDTSAAKMQPGYSLDSLTAISRGNQAFVHKMLQLFIDQSPATMQQMKQACLNGEVDSVKKLAHRLKPSLHNLGMDAAEVQIRNIEKNAAELFTGGMLTKLIEQVADEVDVVAEALKAYLLSK